MSDARDTLRALAAVDRCAAVWCAAQCARACLHLVPEGEERHRLAIEAAEAWAREPSEEAARKCRHCAREAWMAADEMRHAGPFPPIASSANLCDYADESSFGEDFGAGYWTIRQATIALKDSGASSMDAAADILVAITSQLWPLTLPSASAIRAAPAHLAVCWDYLADTEATEIGIPALLEAHALATREGLEWGDPVQRAIAERATLRGGAAALIARGAA